MLKLLISLPYDLVFNDNREITITYAKKKTNLPKAGHDQSIFI